MLTRLRSTVALPVCAIALWAGCGSESHEQNPPAAADEPPASVATDAAPAGESRPPDTTTATALDAPAAPTSSTQIRVEPGSGVSGVEPGSEVSGVEPGSGVSGVEPGSEVSVFPPVVDHTGSGVARLTVEIVESLPHDPDAFTQGLEVVDSTMYESTGLWGRSSLRAVDTASGEVTGRVDLADQYFGEGLTVVGDLLVQLTWRSGTAFVYDRSTLQPVAEHAYDGEGWGLCLSDSMLIMSDGSDRLAHRDPQTFELLATVDVTASGYEGRLDYLNELECVDGLVIANVWQTGQLLVIDPATGRVVAAIDAGPLVDDVHSAAGAGEIDVLNGVAAAGDGSGTLWMTGKLWPRLYRVRIVEAQ